MWMLILGPAAALALLVALVRVLEPRFAFFPMRGESVTPRDFHLAYQSLTIETSDGERLRGWAIDDAHARARILYFHGNGGNLSLWAPILSAIAAHGYAVKAFDYRGYGLSTGRPTERGLYRDVEAAVERFWRDASTRMPVVYWGRSLGVAMASYAATIREPDGLILESGFPDVRALLRDSLVFGLLAHVSSYRFPAAAFLDHLHSPVPTLVMHGDDDHIVPISQGRALFGGLRTPKQFVTIRGGDHNDLTPSDPENYWGAVDAFMESLRK
jgi:alpha-beta hydrolase superfamily lysophospholipase